MEMMALLADSAAEAAAGVGVQSSPVPSMKHQWLQTLTSKHLARPLPRKAKAGFGRRVCPPYPRFVSISQFIAVCSASIKRTRSASTTSDRPALPKPSNEDTPVATPSPSQCPRPQCLRRRVAVAQSTWGGGRSRPSAQAQDAASVDGDEGE